MPGRPLGLAPDTPTVSAGGQVAFSAAGGTGDYTFSVLPGGVGGTIDAVSGVYTAPMRGGTDTVQVDDGVSTYSTVCTVTAPPLTLLQSTAAVRPGMQTTFIGAGGTAPYAYAVLAGGPGGTVDAASGAYVAPQAYGVDTVQVTDHVGATAAAAILSGSPAMLVCDILQQGLGLAAGRVYLWNQKLMQPTDAGVYIAVSVPIMKSFGLSTRFNSATQLSEQYVPIQATVDIDVTSRGPAARDTVEQVLMVLGGDYSNRQQAACGFQIARVPSPILDLSEVDGAAIPYRYRVSVKMLYAASQSPAADYFGNFQTPGVVTDDGSSGGSQTAGTPIPDTGGSQPAGSSIIDGGGP